MKKVAGGTKRGKIHFAIWTNTFWKNEEGTCIESNGGTKRGCQGIRVFLDEETKVAFLKRARRPVVKEFLEGGGKGRGELVVKQGSAGWRLPCVAKHWLSGNQSFPGWRDEGSIFGGGWKRQKGEESWW